MLKYKTDSLEGIDEAHHGLYSEAESGGYVLKVEGAVGTDKFNEVNQRAIENADEARRRRKAVEKWQELGESPDAVREAMNAKGNPDVDHEAVVAQIKADYEAKLNVATGEISAMRSGQAQSQFKAELAKAGFHPEVIDDIAAGSAGRLSFDDEGSLRIMAPDGSKPMAGSGSEGYATVSDLASELAAAKPSFLKDEGKRGGGKPAASNSGSTSGGNDRLSSILGDLPAS